MDAGKAFAAFGEVKEISAFLKDPEEKCFRIPSGKIVIGDPGDDERKGVLIAEKAKPGNWMAWYDEMDGMCGALFSCHEDFVKKGAPDFSGCYYDELGDCEVTYGHAGFFDEKSFGKEEQFEGYPEASFSDGFYGYCCDITLEKPAGLVPEGCIGNCGRGSSPGSYNVDAVYDKKDNCIGLKIRFLY